MKKHQTDERADTSEVCAACGVEYDNNSGGTAGQTYYTKKDHCELSLCEHCIEDAHREEVVAKEPLNGDLLEVSDFDKLTAWARKGMILTFCEKEILSFEDVEKFFDALSATINWHPDSEFSDYVNRVSGERLFDDSQAEQLDKRMVECFTVCEDNRRERRNAPDAYTLALESAQRAGWAPVGKPHAETLTENRAENRAEKLEAVLRDLAEHLIEARMTYGHTSDELASMINGGIAHELLERANKVLGGTLPAFD